MSEFGIIPERWTLAAIQLLNTIALGAMSDAVMTARLKPRPRPEIKAAFEVNAELAAIAAVDREPPRPPIAYV